jgi:hypothetical protein
MERISELKSEIKNKHMDLKNFWFGEGGQKNIEKLSKEEKTTALCTFYLLLKLLCSAVVIPVS